MIRFLSIVLLMQFVQSGFSQNLNKIILDEKRQMDILVGELNLFGITKSIFSEYYIAEFESYQAEQTIIDSLIIKHASDFQYTIVLGSWCSDSQREVPRMLKVLSDTKIDLDNIKLFGVNSNIEAKEAPVANLNIEKVPTLIVFRSGIELGRIIETPVKSIERDILEIVAAY